MRMMKMTVLGLSSIALSLGVTPALAGASGNSGVQDFAGYSAPVSAGAASTTVSAEFTVPSLICDATGPGQFVAFSVQINGTGEGLVGPYAQIRSGCDGATPFYTAVGGGVHDMTISAGDKVVLSASLVASPFRQSTTVKDLTTGVTYGQASTVDPIKAVNVFVGARSLGDSIADFGTIEWVNATFEGSSLGSANPEGLNMINNPGHPKLLVGTSALSPSGSSFKNIWVRGS